MSNCIVDNSALFKSLSPTAKHIASHDANEKLNKNVFGNLIQDAIESKAQNGEEFKKYLRDFEAEILAIREKNGESVRNTNGSYCFSKVSQSSTYRSNKSVICNALDAGVKLTDNDGNPLGKTALEKQRKSVVSKKMTAYERAERAANALIRVWPELQRGEAQAIRDALEDRGI